MKGVDQLGLVPRLPTAWADGSPTLGALLPPSGEARERGPGLQLVRQAKLPDAEFFFSLA